MQLHLRSCRDSRPRLSGRAKLDSFWSPHPDFGRRSQNLGGQRFSATMPPCTIPTEGYPILALLHEPAMSVSKGWNAKLPALRRIILIDADPARISDSRLSQFWVAQRFSAAIKPRRAQPAFSNRVILSAAHRCAKRIGRRSRRTCFPANNYKPVRVVHRNKAACTIPTEVAPSLRPLQEPALSLPKGWDTMLPALRLFFLYGRNQQNLPTHC